MCKERKIFGMLEEPKEDQCGWRLVSEVMSGKI